MYVRMKYITVVLLLHQSMFESLTVMHPQLLAQLEALQEQKSMCLYVLLDICNFLFTLLCVTLRI